MSVKGSSVLRPEGRGRRGAIYTATVAVLAVAASSDIGRAASYSFNYTSSTSGAWSNSNYWLADNSPAGSAPGATDDMITPTGVSSTSGNGSFGTLSVDGARSIRTITYAPTGTLSNAAWTAYGNASASVTVDQNVSVSSGNFTIRSTGSYMPVTINNSGNATNAVTISNGAKFVLGAGTSAAKALQSLSVARGLIDIQSGTFTVNAQTADLDGGVQLSTTNAATFFFNQRDYTTNVAFLSGGKATNKVAMDATAWGGETNFTATLNINGSSAFAPASFAGVIADSSNALRITQVQRSGTGTQTFTGANTYTGGTAISGGTLRADNDSALGSGSVSISGGTLEIASGRTITNNIAMSDGVLDVVGTTNTGTLSITGGTVRGTGTVSQGLTVGSTATLAPGESNAGTLNTTSLTLQDGSVYSVDLTAGSSDQTIATGVSLGNGTLSIASIPAGLPMGTFFDIIKNTGGSAVGLAGGLGFNNLADGGEFTSNGYTFRIDYDGTAAGAQSGGRDVLLTVVPEPSIALFGAAGLLVLRRRRR